MSVARRLQQILVDRPLAPWAMRLGLGRATVEALRADGLPGPRAIERIVAFEGVRRRWLMDGVGERFTVMRTGSDEATAVAVATMLDDRPAWSVHLLDGGRERALVLTHPGRLEAPLRTYTVVAIVAEPVGHRTLAAIEQRRALTGHAVAGRTVAGVRAARVGPYRLLGDAAHPGLLRPAAGERASA